MISTVSNRLPRQGWQAMPFLELVALLMTGWAVYMYAVSFAVQLSGRMVAIPALRVIVFGPAAIMLSMLGLFGMFTRYRQLGRVLITVAVVGVALSACAPLSSGGSEPVCQKMNSYCLSGSPTL